MATSKCCSSYLQFINTYVGQSNDTLAFVNASDVLRIYNPETNCDLCIFRRHCYDIRYGDATFFVMDMRWYFSSPLTGEATPERCWTKETAKCPLQVGSGRYIKCALRFLRYVP